jgi:hypothetical protein
VLTGDLTVIDIDSCVDRETRAISPKARALVQAFGSYTELSPSGTGLHIWCHGSRGIGGRRRGKLEVYDNHRYMTLTGDHLEGTPERLRIITPDLVSLLHRTLAENPSPTDAELLERARSGRNGVQFQRLWNGDTSAYDHDDSAADLALCNRLAFLTRNDATRIDLLFRQSGLMRDKWDQPRGETTYGAMTIARAIDGRREPSGGAPPAPPPRRETHASNAPCFGIPILTRLSDVQAEPVEWLWKGRIAKGKLTLLCGDPGLGKSWVSLDIGARLSRGNPWPDNTPASAPADVLLLSAEDGLADTIRPRLDQLDADTARVHHIDGVRAQGGEIGIQLTHIAEIEAAIHMTGAKLLVIDPLSAYLGDIDAHRDSEVRQLMAPLTKLAERTGIAIIGVMHLGKAAQRQALYRAVGSIAFTAVARVVLAVAADPDQDDRRLLAPVKANLSIPPPTLGYRLIDGRLQWDSDPVTDVDVEALLSNPIPKRQQRRDADTWLLNRLRDGAVESAELMAEAEQEGISRSTLFRAKKRLMIRARRDGYGKDGTWYWQLPSMSFTAEPNNESMTLNGVAGKIGPLFEASAPKGVSVLDGQSLERNEEEGIEDGNPDRADSQR